MFDLAGKRALVTGASGGIGGDTARVALASHHDHPLWSVDLPSDGFNGGWEI